ncbi:unnamed protein product [Lymnaea stagnalis]|uniref:PQ-loop repeat-containing protein 2 n=1 Tax=Lymnaea stagnalis TaxID=6523 RepID=A0AAV2IGH5_LYMST
MDSLYNLLPPEGGKLTNQSNITSCPDGIQWIYAVMGDCCITVREQISAYLGIASIFLWGFVGIPQMCKNICHIAGMVGLSVFLILQWVGGDLANLIGCILTRQNNFQIILAVYFIVMDIFLLVQYMHYLCWKHRKRLRESEGNIQPSPKVLLCLMGLFVFTTTLWNQTFAALSKEITGLHDDYLVAGHTSRSLLFASSDPAEFVGDKPIFWNDTRNVIGYCIGIISAIFYSGSRVSQIYKNVRAQSTEGLAFLTFTVAVFGNLTYGGQIIILDFSGDYVLEKLPWLLGSFGVVLLDCCILFQFMYYKQRDEIKTEEHQSLLTGEYIINADDNSQDEQGEENPCIN